MRRSLSNVARATAAATVIAGASLVAPGIHRAQANSVQSAVNTAATDPRFGIDQVSDHNATVSADYLSTLADQMGARWTRIPFIWKYIQPQAPTGTGALSPVNTGTLAAPAPWPSGWNPFALDANGTDAAINHELTHQREIVGLLLGTPTWACRDKVKASHQTCSVADVPANLADAKGNALPWNSPSNYWGAYCYQLARHFGPDAAHPNGRINRWTIWNEVSIPGGTSWTQWNDPDKAQSEKDYAHLLEIADQAIKAANPKAKVVLYGDPYWYDQGTFLKGVLGNLKHDDPTGKHDGYFDVANLHLYIGTPSFYWIITNLRDELIRHGWTDKKVWVSETNVEPYDDGAAGAFAKRDGTTAFRVTQQEQAGFLVDAFATYIAAQADRFAIYRMLDGDGMTAGLAPLGVVNNAKVERPFGYSFQALARIFKNAQPAVDTESYHAGEFYSDRTVDGRPVYKAGVFKVVDETLDAKNHPTQRITTVWNQFGPLNTAVEKNYTKVTYSWDHKLHYNYNAADHTMHDAKDMIVLPTTDATGHPTPDWAGVSYDIRGAATYSFKAAPGVKTATVYDKYGRATTIHAGAKPVEIDSLNWDGAPLSYVTKATKMTIGLANGTYTVKLRGGTTYSNPADPRIPTVGGDPVIVVEQMGRHI